MKIVMILLMVGLCQLAKAQSGLQPIDTIPKQDSSLMDIKRDALDNLPVINLDDDALDEGSNSTVSSILNAGRNPFLAAASFNFSVARFRLRGYESGGDAQYINGIEFTGLDNGYTPYSLWSGLNNVLRMQQTEYGLGPNDFSIGALALNTNIDLRAGSQRAQTQVGYAFSNRNYQHRINLSHGSGFNHKGWAYSFAFTARYADEGYVPGTFYRGLSYYAAVDKQWANKKHILSIIAFGAPTENGRQTASVQEAMDLAGTNYYNPAWGYQDGKKRNSNIVNTFQPTFLMVHEYKPSNKSRWTTSAGYVFGKRKLSGFDWYNAPDPRPDYYRYLPSYYKDNPRVAGMLRDDIENNPDLLQVNWNRLYAVNRNNVVTIRNVNGEQGNDVTGKRSLYILNNRVTDLKRFMINSVYNTKINDQLSITAGAHYQQQVNHYYQEVNDLLGGDFWLNVNQFAERDFPNDPNSFQYDVDHPNQLKRKGDQYGYNYRMTMNRYGAWGQAVINLRKIDLFAAVELSSSSFYRTGLNRNGLFPQASYGDSKKTHFLNNAEKAGITYKLNGRNYFFMNAAHQTNPPFFDNVFISQRTRNTLQEDIAAEKIWSAEGGYRMNAPQLRLNITGFYTQSEDGYDVMSFYHDQEQNFVNYALSGIDKLFFGVETGVDWKISSTLNFNGAASIGRYYYNSRQKAVITVDNSASVLSRQTVYLKNFRVPSTPQNAYSGGFFYRSPRFWYISLTGNLFGNMWLSPNPLRRTTDALAGLDANDATTADLIHTITSQEKMKDQFTLDFFGGWSKRLPSSFNIGTKPVYLVFNLGVNNLLNNKTIRSGGYEQLRFDYETKDVNKFAPKYYYAYGLNYFASMTIRF